LLHTVKVVTKELGKASGTTNASIHNSTSSFNPADAGHAAAQTDAEERYKKLSKTAAAKGFNPNDTIS